jgi:mRNA-degrading endonuclease RelE of RelBE toxin-antitoxin system
VYVIKFTDEGLADVKALPGNVRNALKADLIEKVATDPYNHSQALLSALKGWRSFGFREYRVIFKIYDDLKAIGIAAIGEHDPDAHKDVYKKLEALVIGGSVAEKMLITMRGFTLRQPED